MRNFPVISHFDTNIMQTSHFQKHACVKTIAAESERGIFADFIAPIQQFAIPSHLLQKIFKYQDYFAIRDDFRPDLDLHNV